MSHEIILVLTMLFCFLVSCSNKNSCDGNPFRAVEQSNLKCFENYLKTGGQLNCIDKNRIGLIQHALSNRVHQSEFVRLLMQYGADPNFIPPGNDPPLVLAALWADEKSVKLLLENGADINLNDRNGRRAIDNVADAGPVTQRIKKLLKDTHK
jgi:ankyrin repeat protein